MGAKKTNPRRIPATMADVNKAKTEAMSIATESALVIFFTVLRDKEYADTEILKRVYNEINDLSESIVNGYVNVADLKDVLKQEAGITFS